MNCLKKILFFDKLVFYVEENVYEPAEDTFLLAENLEVSEEDVVLDVGTGCGMLGILAAKKAREVIAVDINPHAVRCARENAKLNSVLQKMCFLQCDLFGSLRPNKMFTLIIFNAPYLPSKPEEQRAWIELSWAGGPDGREIIDRFIRQVPRYLAENGRVLLVQSSLADIDKTLQMLKEEGLRPKVTAERKVSFETLVIVEASRDGS